MTRKRSLRNFIRSLKDGDILVVRKKTVGCECRTKRRPDKHTTKITHFDNCRLKKSIKGAEVYLVGNRPEQTLWIGTEKDYEAPTK